MTDGNPQRKKLFGILSIPGWLGVLVEILHLAEDVDWITDKFPLLMRFVNHVIPAGVDYPVLILSASWILAFLIVGPRLARRVGPAKATATILIPLFLAAFVIGLMRGGEEIDRPKSGAHGKTTPAKQR
ncbi:MAG TPA: hypothetical protein VKW06_08875 [Candidatus Angelobacter sp.]|nr:hypothetical protein [Candidatus Angelobacter sp.]